MPGVSAVSGQAGLRHNGNWQRLWLGQAVSLVGDSVFTITVLLWVATVIAKGRPWAPAAASGVLIAAAVPVLVIGPAAGVYLDRWNRRRIMMVADACRAGLVAALLALPALGPAGGPAAEVAAVYLVVAGCSAAAQFFNPSRLAMLGRIVPPADRARASGMLQAAASLAAIAGPPLAAPLLFAFGPRWALIIDAASFVVSFLAVRAIRLPRAARPDPPGPGFRAEFREGLRFFAASRVLTALCLGVAIATLGTGALNALEVFFVTGNLHTAARWLGVLAAVTGAGAVAGALLAGWAAGRAGAARVFWLGLISGGLLLAAFSRMTVFWIAVVIGALVGVAFGAINAAVPPLLLDGIPPDLIGRIMAIFNPVQQVANVISMAVAGLLASTALRGMHVVIAGASFGPVDTIFGCSALLIAAAGLAAIRPLRRADQRAEPTAAPGAGPGTRRHGHGGRRRPHPDRRERPERC
jgi:MFS family permease